MSTSPASQPLVDLGGLLAGIRRRRRFWLTLGLIGLLAGGALALLLPSPPTASTRLLIIHEEDQPSDSGTLIKTDLAVLETSRIAAAAVRTLHSTESPEDFLKHISAVGVSNNVLELSAKGSSTGDAVARAKAMADAFINDYVQRIQAGATAEQQALFKQRDQAQAELTQVDAQITQATGRSSQTPATQLESLYAHRADLASRVSDLTGRAEEAGIGAPKVAAGTQIMDAPHPVPSSLLKTGATDAGMGLALGLVVGIALSAISGVVRDRPVLRRDISAHLGASVIAQFRTRSVKERKRVATTLVRIIDGVPNTVSLLELGCPTVQAALAQDMAEEVGTDGEGVRLGSVTPGTSWTDLPQLGSETLLIVRAGFANAQWLHTVARQLADCQIPILGVVLVDPDPKDHTDGTLWDGLHTALRGRDRKPQTHNGELPTKILAPVKREVS
ncbi:MAG TPA: Wzz/FepE/Etk N-terminal domain-containing protein [Amycolatopsis sp.]|uniref:Wzz/FepE/Etk N-terminal domain-containing protein n=1 Tax=Amycolatopsis sp. TaxID=37632 RepID=UPI002B468CE7|nr:Wzz/FepE/Etk N-terminal domain-containing protein [Amycolatopsis sp.]HKS47417.1 Wzz/FepE/Etk N-terminal domain-containing protein [Amycolatopsis sp.]